MRMRSIPKSSFTSPFVHFQFFLSIPSTTTMGHALTIQQKQLIIAEHNRRCEKNENSSQKSLELWAKSQFHLPKVRNQATISRLLFAKSKYICLPPTVRTKFKTVRLPAAPRLELALQNWLCDKIANGM